MSVDRQSHTPESEQEPRRQSTISEAGLKLYGADLGELARNFDQAAELKGTFPAELQLGKDVRLSLKHVDANILSRSTAIGADGAPAGSVLLYARDPAGLEGFRDHVIPPGASVVVGRETMTGLPDTVSRRHVEVGVTEYGEIWAKDLGSTNGTRIEAFREN